MTTDRIGATLVYIGAALCVAGYMVLMFGPGDENDRRDEFVPDPSPPGHEPPVFPDAPGVPRHEPEVARRMANEDVRA